MRTDGYTLDLRVGILNMRIIEGEELVKWFGGELKL
jgi:hypothetical protein